MKIRFNFKVFTSIFLLTLLLYYIMIFMYEGIKIDNFDYGKIGNMIVLNLAGVFQFPVNTLITTPKISYLTGTIINIFLYTCLLYIIISFLLNKFSHRGNG